MATNTQNINLVKPSGDDFYDISTQNGNMDKIDTAFAESMYFTTNKSGLDSNGIYTEVDHKRKDGTIIEKSILSGGTSPLYTTRTDTKYASDGTTVQWIKTYTLTYDVNQNVVSEVLQ